MEQVEMTKAYHVKCFLLEERTYLMNLIMEAVPSFGVSRISKISEDVIMLEGGKFPATFDKETQTLHIHSRAFRAKGKSATVDEIIKLEQALRLWSKEREIGKPDNKYQAITV